MIKFFILITLLFTSINILAEEKILFAIDLIRHGDRTPTNEIPKAKYPWKEGLGNLTAKGIQQEISLGKEFRKRYVEQTNLLPVIYDPSTLYVYSTDFQRTKLSAHALLLGLYPTNIRTPPNLIIPIYVNSKDYLLTVKPKNNILAAWNLYLISHKAWQEKSAALATKINHWSEQTGEKLHNFQNLALLGDNLYIRKLHHVALPPGIDQADANEIMSLTQWAIVKKFKLEDVTYPMGHEFLNAVATYFKNAIAGKTLLKYVLFSGHDSSIMAVMNTLQAPLNQIPNYASDLNFTLFENHGKYFVRVTLNNKPIRLNNCSGYVCEISAFIKLTQI